MNSGCITSKLKLKIAMADGRLLSQWNRENDPQPFQAKPGMRIAGAANEVDHGFQLSRGNDDSPAILSGLQVVGS
jgi:hypothetical protein